MNEGETQSRFTAKNKNIFAYFPFVFAVIFLVVLGLYLDRLNSNAEKQGLKNHLLDQVGVVRARLEGNINNNLMVVKGLVAAISIEPNISQERFLALSTPLLSGSSQIRNIAAAPDLVIRYMNPVAGNEAAIGLDYRTIPKQFDTVKRVRDSGGLVLAGPVNLVQGGKGLIARIPVYIESEIKDKKVFWGIISSVIDIEKFYSASGLRNSELTFDVAIRGKDALGSEGDVFFGEESVFISDPVLTDISLPYGSWQLAAVPKGGWLKNTENINNYRMKLIALGFVILIPFFVLSRSMSERRESEARLRLLFERSPVGIALNCYDTGAFVEANNALLRQIGYTADEFLQLNYWDITPVKYENDEAVQLESLEKTGQYGPYEKEYIRKDGSHYPVLLKGMIVYDSSGNKMIWSFIEDISKRKQAEKSLQRSQKMDAVGQLTGGIAHDFNNILGIILGNLELLKSDLPKELEKLHRRVDSIQEAGQRAVDLTKQLLSFSRSKPSRQDVVNINELVEKIENLIARSVTPEIAVSHEFDENLWLTKIDRGEFEDAMLNLSLNAHDAMSGHGHLIIRTRNVIIDDALCEHIINAAPGEYVELAVSDTGEGVSAENQEHIFEPFYTTKEEGKGTGLGLSMVYGFVQRSGGFIDINSELGIGTTFKLYLPRFKGEEKSPAQMESNKNVVPPRGSETILIVDDEDALLEVASSFLTSLGYNVLTSVNGQEALKKIKQHSGVDLLISDVVMPGGINGLELVKQAETKFPNLKVMLTSGYTGKVVDAEKTERSGFKGSILNKPYAQNELANRVRKILDGGE